MVDVSHAGTTMFLQASVTFAGAPLPIIYLPDDNDPFSAADITIGDAVMGTNGTVITWSQATMVEFTISVVANSPNWLALATLLDANAVGPFKIPARDVIKLTRVMPNGNTLTLKNVTLTGGTPLLNMMSSGRVANPTYTFKAPPTLELGVPQL